MTNPSFTHTISPTAYRPPAGMTNCPGGKVRGRGVDRPYSPFLTPLWPRRRQGAWYVKGAGQTQTLTQTLIQTLTVRAITN